jgi:hypothetical protein
MHSCMHSMCIQFCHADQKSSDVGDAWCRGGRCRLDTAGRRRQSMVREGRLAGGGGHRPYSPPAGLTAASLPVSAVETPCCTMPCCGTLCRAATISARVLRGDGIDLVWSHDLELLLQEEVPWECREVRVMGRTVNQPRCASMPAAPHFTAGRTSSRMALHSAEGSIMKHSPHLGA